MVIKTKLVNVTSVPRSTLGGTQRVHSASLAKPVMLACGTCDAAGESAFSVGLPCKSGVADGIMAAAPITRASAPGRRRWTMPATRWPDGFPCTT